MRLDDVIAWGRIPWPLWVLLALTVAGLATLDASASGPTGVKIFVPIITVVWLLFPVQGSPLGVDCLYRDLRLQSYPVGSGISRMVQRRIGINRSFASPASRNSAI